MLNQLPWSWQLTVTRFRWPLVDRTRDCVSGCPEGAARRTRPPAPGSRRAQSPSSPLRAMARQQRQGNVGHCFLCLRGRPSRRLPLRCSSSLLGPGAGAPSGSPAKLQRVRPLPLRLEAAPRPVGPPWTTHRLGRALVASPLSQWARTRSIMGSRAVGPARGSPRPPPGRRSPASAVDGPSMTGTSPPSANAAPEFISRWVRAGRRGRVPPGSSDAAPPRPTTRCRLPRTARRRRRTARTRAWWLIVPSSPPGPAHPPHPPSRSRLPLSVEVGRAALARWGGGASRPFGCSPLELRWLSRVTAAARPRRWLITGAPVAPAVVAVIVASLRHRGSARRLPAHRAGVAPPGCSPGREPVGGAWRSPRPGVHPRTEVHGLCSESPRPGA